LQSYNSDQPITNQSVDEKLFRLLIATVKGYAIFMIDPNGYVMSWNQGAAHIKGYNEEEIIGKHISVFYTADDNDKNESRYNLNEALKRGSYENEGWRVRKDGSIFWANVVFTTLYNDEGHLVGLAKITRDITERKQNEDKKEIINAELERRDKENKKKIITNELKFRKLIEQSYEGISLLDKNLHVIFRSISSERINGWSNIVMDEGEITELAHPDDKILVNRLFADLLARPGVPIISEFRTRHRQGHYIWVECLYNNMLGDKNISAIVCNFRDVTDRKNAEEEIRKKTEQIEDILESITDGFIAMDSNFCITYANKRISEMIGYSAETIIGKYVWDQFPEAVGSETYKAFNKAFTEQKYVCHEDYYAPSSLWQENHIYPSAGGLSVFVRDISERKKAEKEILLFNENLEKKVVERTLQLEAANKELESFSYSVSHDLRTPLRAVNGYAMMLKEDFGSKLGAEGDRVINIIMDNARRMGQLIDDLLTFSHLGRKEIKSQNVDINEMVKMCIKELLLNEVKKYQVKVRELPQCQADGAMLKQVWMNLIGNAIKYSSKQDLPKIEIGFTSDKKRDIYYVKDNGVGFDMQYSNKLFGVFQRLHSNDQFEGTGVGLALVKRIIDKHGGEIWVEAHLNEGATFYFSLTGKKNNLLENTKNE
jgi:PAS domain S-box-containing protein